MWGQAQEQGQGLSSHTRSSRLQEAREAVKAAPDAQDVSNNRGHSWQSGVRLGLQQPGLLTSPNQAGSAATT